MNLFDPQRPKASTGLPQILDSPVDLVPNFYIFPVSNNAIEILAFLRRDSGGHAAFRLVVALEELPGVLQSFIADPEGFLLQHWSWSPPKRGRAAQVAAVKKPRPLPQDAIPQIQGGVEANADDF